MEQIIGLLVVAAIFYAAYRLFKDKDEEGGEQPPSNPKDDGTRHN
jgi:hypothetical protein